MIFPCKGPSMGDFSAGYLWWHQRGTSSLSSVVSSIIIIIILYPVVSHDIPIKTKKTHEQTFTYMGFSLNFSRFFHDFPMDFRRAFGYPTDLDPAIKTQDRTMAVSQLARRSPRASRDICRVVPQVVSVQLVYKSNKCPIAMVYRWYIAIGIITHLSLGGHHLVKTSLKPLKTCLT